MLAEFRAPRRRNRVHEEYEAPLPVTQSPEERSDFRAELINQHVLVRNPDHIQRIYNQGYFGKGILSRARPDHSISDQWEQHKGLCLPVVSQSRYEERLKWAGAALSAQGLDDEAVSQILTKLSQPVEAEDVRREGPRPEGGVCPHTKRLRSEVKPKAKRFCRLESQDLNLSSDQDSDYDPDAGSNSGSGSGSDSDSDPDPEPVVPGPGFVLVDCDGDVRSTDSESRSGSGLQVRELRHNPVSVSEYLQLSVEEAFFLVYSLGCLSVHLHQEPLSIIQLWRTFQSQCPHFISSYAAYHHFRMLYRKGPPFYHASYSVVVERVDDAFRDTALRPFSWRSLAALNRITANVSKELMLCYIIYPSDLSEVELESPDCLSRLKVQEVMVSRWVSSRERAEQDDI